jgi:hypothetical protein
MWGCLHKTCNSIHQIRSSERTVSLRQSRIWVVSVEHILQVQRSWEMVTDASTKISSILITILSDIVTDMIFSHTIPSTTFFFSCVWFIAHTHPIFIVRSSLRAVDLVWHHFEKSSTGAFDTELSNAPGAIDAVGTAYKRSYLLEHSIAPFVCSTKLYGFNVHENILTQFFEYCTFVDRLQKNQKLMWNLYLQ